MLSQNGEVSGKNGSLQLSDNKSEIEKHNFSYERAVDVVFGRSRVAIKKDQIVSLYPTYERTSVDPALNLRLFKEKTI
jgi:hypothetical protein